MKETEDTAATDRSTKQTGQHVPLEDVDLFEAYWFAPTDSHYAPSGEQRG